MAHLMQDARFALRLFRRHPGYVAMVAGTLGVALGGITALTSVIDATLLAPLPIAGGERVVTLHDRQPQYDAPASASWPEVVDWRREARQLSAVAAERTQNMTWRGQGEPERVRAALVSEDYFRVFAMTPTLGRGFSAEEHRKGGPAAVVLGDGLFQRAFGGDPHLVGRTIQLDGVPFTVVGVLPAGGQELARGRRDAFIPLEPRLPSEERGEHYLNVYGRLADGATMASLTAELDRLGPLLDTTASGHRIDAVTLRDALYGKARPGLTLLLFAALFVLVIAGSNVTGIMLARMHGRAQELGVRAALGASRGRLVRQLIVESVLLSLLGGALGLLLALWGKDLLLAMWPDSAARPPVVPLAWRTLALTVAAALAVGALIGAAPALRGSRADLSSTLRGSAIPRTQRLRAALVVLQHAVAIVLLSGAALLGKSMLHLMAAPPGFDPGGVVTMDVALPEARYPDDARRRAFYEDVAARLRALPGVEMASVISNLPFGRSNTSGSFEIEGRPELPAATRPHTAKMLVDGDFFRLMRIPVIAGRTFTTSDHRLLMVVSKTFADRFFPGESPIGHRIDTWGGFAEVVGVVGDVRTRGLEDAPEPQIYENLAQTVEWATFVVRTGGDPTRLFGAMKAQVFAVDPDQPVSSLATLSDLIAQSAAQRRIVTIMVAAFAAMALFLAALGIYGVLSYSVSQRTREIGVRMALGARAGVVLRHVLAQGLRLSLLGIALGIGGALVAARLLGAFLYHVSPSDPPVYAAVAAGLVLVGLLACWAPARRAAKVDPMKALRAE